MGVGGNSEIFGPLRSPTGTKSDGGGDLQKKNPTEAKTQGLEILGNAAAPFPEKICGHRKKINMLGKKIKNLKKRKNGKYDKVKIIFFPYKHK